MSKSVYTLRELAEHVSAEIQGDPNCEVASIATLQSAGKKQISFIANPKYQKYLATTQAEAVILSEQDKAFFPGNALVVKNAYLAYAQISQLFAPAYSAEHGVAASAVIAPSATIEATAIVSEGVVVGERCVIAAGVVLKPNVVIGDDCKVGVDSVIEASVTLYNDVHLGQRCLVHSGAVLGADGFGFANEQGKWLKIAQLGGVRVGDDVEIGACTTIDRGALEHTIIGNGVILDNQIQIAHNVIIGNNSAIAGCTAVAGSTKIGDRCTIAGACGITGHLEIANDVHVTAMSLVTKSIVKSGVYSSGTGMMENKQWKKNVVRFRQLHDMAQRLKKIEDQIEEIKGS